MRQSTISDHHHHHQHRVYPPTSQGPPVLPRKPLLQVAQQANEPGEPQFSILFARARALLAAFTLPRLNSFVNTIDFLPSASCCQLKRNLFQPSHPPERTQTAHIHTNTVLKITYQLIIRRQPRNKRLQICIVSVWVWVWVGNTPCRCSLDCWRLC